MGAGQIGGIATLLDIDFNNAVGFVGTIATASEAKYIVHYLSHALMFCVGSLIEAHIVLTTANCVYGEKYRFDVFGGTHKFLEHHGSARMVEHVAIHRGYNHTLRYEACGPDNLALLVLGYQFRFHKREENTDFILSRLRYGLVNVESLHKLTGCRFYGWGSRRNGYLVPLLINLRRVDVHILEKESCQQMWNYGDKYLCIRQLDCKSEKYGALCPDDMGTVLECNGYLRGIMTSRLIDRPCGIGFLDTSKYIKFITCGVDDSRDILGHDDLMEFQTETSTFNGPDVKVVELPENGTVFDDPGIIGLDPGPPTTKADGEDYLMEEDNTEATETFETSETPETPIVPERPVTAETPEAPETPVSHEDEQKKDHTF